jgi:putative acetyltransferase
MDIRLAKNEDRDDIRRIYSSAFPKGEREIVEKLAVDLLSEKTAPQTISLIAETGDAVVGHAAFSPVEIDNDGSCQAYILAPLAVQADFQKRRIGSTLVEYGLQQLSAMGVNVVFVYGDPKYYERFGFKAATARNFITPYNLQYPFAWQGLILNQCVLEKASVSINCVTSLCDPGLW